jgi:hypothetical protein
MSGFLRKVAHATSSNKPESTEETRAIEEELSVRILLGDNVNKILNNRM